ncbi:hypothetical protein M153_924000777 [Pseudoloma neurophilia]|uniref:Uncharacterized protein n=1 Tax=Pseudoloma neurophilia TaxID=146866 RepID=A0A0R0M1X1_9MICR|nr:hypothetical protein M153_924000777 [Pseudoloma neurophilia]
MSIFIAHDSHTDENIKLLLEDFTSENLEKFTKCQTKISQINQEYYLQNRTLTFVERLLRWLEVLLLLILFLFLLTGILKFIWIVRSLFWKFFN